MLLLWIRVLKVLTLMEGSVYNGCTLTNLVSFYFGMKVTGFFTCNRGLPLLMSDVLPALFWLQVPTGRCSSLWRDCLFSIKPDRAL